MQTENNKKATKATPLQTTVTLSMVADRAGVSAATVSRILNNTAVVSAAKRQAIDDAIAALGYVPNPVARGLAGGKTFSIGIITQNLDSPFYGASMRGIEIELEAAGYSALFVSGHWHADEEARCVDVLRSRRVDGIILLTGRLSDSSLKRIAKQMPLVVTGRSLKAPQLYSLNFDNLEGARLATEKLIQLGHRDIAFVGGVEDHPDAVDRHQGYAAALQQYKIPYDKRLVLPGQYIEESGILAIEELFKRKRAFTAIFAANDQMAWGAALGLHRRGVRVPHDVSLIGFDDLTTSTYTTPPLSTIRQPAQEIGRLAALSMLALLRGERPHYALPTPQWVERESTSAVGVTPLR